jgi:hypothetical protein
MKNIERYLSAYVVDCLFGHTDDLHMNYVYQVLRESGSKTDHPVLSKVLDYVRQGDPQDTPVKDEVRAYVLAMAQGGWKPVSHFRASVSTKNGMCIFVVSDGKQVLSIGVAQESEQEQAFDELRQIFPGITFVNA